MPTLPTLYEQALAAWKTGNDEFVAGTLFAFELEDSYYIERVAHTIRSLLQRPNISPSQIVAVGRALLGLGRLPLRTPGLKVRIALVDKFNNAAEVRSLTIQEDIFSTDTSGFDDFGFGSESYSGTLFEVGINFRQCDAWSIIDERWPDVFQEMTAAELEIDDDSDDQLLDWEHPDGSEFWEWVERHG
jgi:hypothetical protein